MSKWLLATNPSRYYGFPARLLAHHDHVHRRIMIYIMRSSRERSCSACRVWTHLIWHKYVFSVVVSPQRVLAFIRLEALVMR